MTDDGGFAFVGYTYSFGAGDQDGWFVKIDSTGTILWNQTYGGAAHESILSLQKIGQGGFLLSGSSGSYGSGDTDIILIKTDAYGIIPEFSTFHIFVAIIVLTGMIVFCKKKLKH